MENAKLPKIFVLDQDSDADLNNEIKKKIVELGGHLKSGLFTEVCTHLICSANRMTATENTMCGLLYGKWIINTHYIINSHAAGHWLEEERYEPTQFLNLAKYWRTQNSQPFKKIYYIHCRDEIRLQGFTRVLIAGGGNVLSRNDIKEKKPEISVCDDTCYAEVLPLVCNEVPILSINYIKDIIFHKRNPNNYKRYILGMRSDKMSKETVKIELLSQGEGSSKGVTPRKRNLIRIPFTRENYRSMDEFLTNGAQQQNKSNDECLEIVYENVNKPRPSRSSEVKPRPSRSSEVVTLSSDSEDEKPQVKKNPSVKLSASDILKIVKGFVRTLKSFDNLLLFPLAYCPLNKPDIKVEEMTARDFNFVGNAITPNKDVTRSVKRGRFKMSKLELVEKTEDEKYFLEFAFDWASVKVSPAALPHAEFVGCLIYDHIILSSSKVYYNGAMKFIQDLILFHPPWDSNMRNYWIRVYEYASFPKGESTSKPSAWQFFEKLINRELILPKEQSLDLSCSPIEILITPIYLDLYYSNKRYKNIKSLMVYRLFWNDVENITVSNQRVKKMIEFFCKSSTASISTKKAVTFLFSVMLDILFKWGSPSTAASMCSWPPNIKWQTMSYTILTHFKNSDATNNILKSFNCITVPWQKMYLYFIFYRARRSTFTLPNFNLAILYSMLETETNLCTNTDMDESERHTKECEIIAEMCEAFLEGIGVFFFRKGANKAIKRGINSPGNSQESETSYGLSQDEDSDSINEYERQIFSQIQSQYKVVTNTKKQINILQGKCSHLRKIPFNW